MENKHTHRRSVTARHRIRSRLRCEGAGRLDCAEDRSSGRRVAIRWVPVEAGADRATRAAQQMPLHPSLPKIRDSGLEGDLAWVAMDFPEGRLFSSVGPAEATPEWLRRVGADIAEALATLHDQGIVHGEVGSDSILLVDGRTAILWDAPLVVMDRLTDRRGGERRLAALRRKASFVAPECARGDDPTEASDVYSLGAVLCLAMGAAPARSTLGTLFAIGSGQWRPTVPASLPEPLAASLARMTSFDPRDRPSAAKIAELWRRTTSRAPFEPHFPFADPAGYVVSDGPRTRAEAALTPFSDAGDLQRTERIPERAIDARLAAVDIRLFRAASRQAEAHRLTPADLAAVHPGRAALATIALGAGGSSRGVEAAAFLESRAPAAAPCASMRSAGGVSLEPLLPGAPFFGALAGPRGRLPRPGVPAEEHRDGGLGHLAFGDAEHELDEPFVRRHHPDAVEAQKSERGRERRFQRQSVPHAAGAAETRDALGVQREHVFERQVTWRAHSASFLKAPAYFSNIQSETSLSRSSRFRSRLGDNRITEPSVDTSTSLPSFRPSCSRSGRSSTIPMLLPILLSFLSTF